MKVKCLTDSSYLWHAGELYDAKKTKDFESLGEIAINDSKSKELKWMGYSDDGKIFEVYLDKDIKFELLSDEAAQ